MRFRLESADASCSRYDAGFMSPRSLRGTVAVAGIGETAYYKRGESPDAEFALTLKAILAACEDAGLDARELDGFASYSNDRNEPSRLAAALGLPELRFSNMNWGGGDGWVSLVGFDNPTTDNAAKAQLEAWFPGRDVYVIEMLESWIAGGGVHCHTNDQPAPSTIGTAPTAVRGHVKRRVQSQT